MKNQPLKKYYDLNHKKQYTGDIVSKHPNRKERRLPIQKSETNPLYGIAFHTHATLNPQGKGLIYKIDIQKVWNKTKNKVITILHTKYI